MATGMDSVNVPEELLQHLLGQTNGSAIQREQIAAAVRQRLMTAEPMPAGAMTAAAAAAIQPAIDCAPRASGSQPPAVRWIRRCAVTRRIPGPPRDLLLVARDLAFRPAGNTAGLSGLSGAQPGVMAAAAAPFQHPSAASYWPLHPAAIQPSYYRDQLHRSPAPHVPTPPQPQRYQLLDGGAITCHRCGGIGHMGRECPSVPGKRETVGATPASTYETALRIAAVAGNREPLLEVRIGRTTFLALLDTGSSVSLLGTPAARVAEATGAKHRVQERALRLATEEAFTALKQSLAHDAVMSLPDLNRPFVVETDASGIGIAAVLLQA
ncbi:hypothetical protein MRX96_011234 [Rhipicephalus microplus]